MNQEIVERFEAWEREVANKPRRGLSAVRKAKLVFEVYKMAGSKLGDTFSMTDKELANIAGISVAAAAIGKKLLRDEGVIEIVGGGKKLIRKPIRLTGEEFNR